MARLHLILYAAPGAQPEMLNASHPGIPHVGEVIAISDQRHYVVRAVFHAIEGRDWDAEIWAHELDADGQHAARGAWRK